MVPSLNIYYVYGHYRKDTNTLFYVGKGSKKRINSHQNRNQHWKNIVNKAGFYTFIFCQDISEDEAYILEKCIITDTNPEANYAVGGRWGGFKGKKHTKETLLKMSLAQKGISKLPTELQILNMTKTMRERYAHKLLDIRTGKLYLSHRDCAKHLKIARSSVQNLIRKKILIKT